MFAPRLPPQLVACDGVRLHVLSAAAPQPSAVMLRSGAIAVTLPSDLLRTAEVKEQLTSGLTTVFIITGSAAGSKAGARIEVRYQLWEEKYLVSVIDAAGAERKLTLDSEAALANWWKSDPQLVIAAPHPSGPVDVDVKLTMLPFSAQEQNDTRRWLSRTLSASGEGDGANSPERAAQVLRIIVQTSIQRKPLLQRTWSVRAR